MRKEDIDLAAENSPGLNRDFYRSEPHTHIRHRLSNLMLVAARDEELSQLLSQGVTFGLVSITPKEGAPPAYGKDERESAEQFVALEAEVLLHHATETLLRLFLAHAGLPPCPWLEMSRLRSFKRFKEILHRRFIEDSGEDRFSDVESVFFGGPELRQSVTESPSEEEWAEAVRTVDQFLVRYAVNLLDDAHLYNAAKHGLAVKPGEFGVTLGAKENPIINRHGMALQYLEVIDDEWKKTIEWVETETSLTYVWMAAELMEQLWNVGRQRYTGEGGNRLNVWREDILQVIDETTHKLMGDGPAVLKSMSENLLYYRPLEEE